MLRRLMNNLIGQPDTLNQSPAKRRLRMETLEEKLPLTTFFVSENGNDGNNGRSYVSAFATIQAAVDAADESQNAGADTIYVLRGTYNENVTIDDADPLTIQGLGNVIIDGTNSGDVIQMLQGDLTLRNLTLTNGSDGVDAEGNSLLLDRVNARDNSEDGVDASELDNIRVNYGNYTDNGNDGIHLDDVREAFFRSVNASGNNSDGIDVEGDVGGPRVTELVQVFGGTFNNNISSDGLELEADEIVVSNVTANNNGAEGLDIDDGGTAEVTSSLFSGNNDEGIDADELDSIVLTNVRSLNNGLQGLEVDTTNDVTVRGGQYSNNGSQGIDIDASGTVIVHAVQARMNGAAGMRVRDAMSVTVSSGNFSDNGANGINLVNNDEVRVLNVTASNNLSNGLRVAGGASATEVSIQSSRFNDNGVDGIRINNAGDIDLRAVTAQRNLDDGIDISNSGVVTQFLVNAKDNGDQDIVIT